MEPPAPLRETMDQAQGVERQGGEMSEELIRELIKEIKGLRSELAEIKKSIHGTERDARESERQIQMERMRRTGTIVDNWFT